jgi:hypothetical protein
MQPAGMSANERLAACSQVLGREPETGNLTVWLGFTNAMLSTGYLSLGPVEFSTGQAWPEAIGSGWPDGDPRRQEEFASDHLRLFFDDPPDPPSVVARMSLGRGSVGESVDRARRWLRT